MNLFQQTKTFLIGSENDVAALAEKKEVTILAFSDSHGSENNAKAILDHFASECDMIVFCGDGTYEITALLEQIKKSKKLSKEFPSVVAIVQGNGDDNEYAVDFNLSENKDDDENYLMQIPRELLIKTAGMNVFVTHGAAYGVYYGLDDLEKQAEILNADLVLYGHTHIADRTDIEQTSFINPGSCTLPRRGLPPSCAVIKLPGDQEKISCTFYERKVSLTEGISFIPFSPSMRTW